MIRMRQALPLVLLVFLISSIAPRNASAGAEPPGQRADLSDVQGLEDFFDGLAAAQLVAYPVAGMTISVVQDGQLLLAKGYGYADVEEGRMVEADRTLFRIGSVSKLFVWTAMMQLVEAGELDLDADINSYLDFAIPEAFERPITLRHLMTHTAGFEDQGLGLFLAEEEQLVPLEQYLAENTPARVFPPGEIGAYSNYGATLAAYIVQRVSGMPFYEYAEERIFEPLGMEQSSFRQPLPRELADNLSEGYLYEQGRFQEEIFEFVQPYPVGSLSTTATDMSRFMIAHLQNGRLGDGRILQEETARSMHRLAFTHDPRLPGWGAGFTVSDEGGIRTTGHGGDTIFFHSELLLLPDENVGIFVSTNSDGGTFARFHMIQAFMERYFVETAPERPEPPEAFLERADVYTGTYFPARMNFSGLEKFLSLLRPVQVRATEEGLLAVSGLLGSTPLYWVEREPDLFMPVSTDVPENMVLLFQTSGDEDGEQADYLFFGQSAYIRQPFYGTPAVHLPLLGLSLLFFVVMLVAVPVGSAVRRQYRGLAPRVITAEPAAAGLARWTAWLFALLNLLFLLLFFVTVSNINNVVFGLPPLVQTLLLIPWISLFFGAAVLVFAGLAWVRGIWPVGYRVFYSLFAVMAVVYLWVLSFWNLM